VSDDPESPSDVPLLREWTGDMDGAESLTLGGAQLVVFTRRCPEVDRPNQDAVALVALGDERLVIAVADGAGGQPAGDRASEAAVSTFAATVREVADGHPLREAILQGFDRANRAVIDLGVGAATTLVVAELEGALLRTYHAGDSRALVCGQRGALKLLTAAHSPVGHAVQAGILEEDEALHHEELHFVSNVLGGDDMRVEMGAPLELADHDTVLLASDGVFDNLGPEEIVEQVRKGPLPEAIGALIDTIDRRMTGDDPDAPSKPDDVSLIGLRRSR
jgi:serine/threonine protein phosphatase PrpC